MFMSSFFMRIDCFSNLNYHKSNSTNSISSVNGVRKAIVFCCVVDVLVISNSLL
jgi:hypothetical protein